MYKHEQIWWQILGPTKPLRLFSFIDFVDLGGKVSFGIWCGRCNWFKLQRAGGYTKRKHILQNSLGTAGNLSQRMALHPPSIQGMIDWSAFWEVWCREALWLKWCLYPLKSKVNSVLVIQKLCRYDCFSNGVVFKLWVTHDPQVGCDSFTDRSQHKFYTPHLGEQSLDPFLTMPGPPLLPAFISR